MSGQVLPCAHEVCFAASASARARVTARGTQSVSQHPSAATRVSAH